MTIFVKGADVATLLRKCPFESESELEALIAAQPSLIALETEEPIALVQQQLTLPAAGKLDLLCVDGGGLPIAVEVKLARNSESRREVVAQIIDYLSDLTRLTVDELDQLTIGELDRALRELSGEEGDAEFEDRWLKVGTNLREGRARVVLVLDDLATDLERMVRFLSERTQLDIRLVTVAKHVADDGQMIFVPHVVIHGVDERSPNGRAVRPELAAVLSEYERIPGSFRVHPGQSSSYRQIRIPGWPARIHYEFLRVRTGIGAEIHLEAPSVRHLQPLLRQLADELSIPGAEVAWDPAWMRKCGRLLVRFPFETPPAEVAAGMCTLILNTKDRISEALRQPVAATR